MKVELPTEFKIDYPNRNIKYYSAYGKPKLVKKLYDSCNGYCMYCGKLVNVEGDRNFHLEHSVDKDGNTHQEMDPYGVLEHCKFNLAIACSKCNLVCKKMVDKVNLASFFPLSKCPSNCDDMCEKYSRIREEYITKNAIILQPKGIQQPVPHLIAYDLLKHIYVPMETNGNEAVMFTIQNHIDRFELNGERFSTSIIELSSKIVLWYERGIKDVEGLLDALNAEKSFNVLGDRFTVFVQEYFSDKVVDELIDFCKLLIVLDAVP